ncbi:hypothetical protein BN2475_630042 [Paraburkholderia ribeironis]|uniref:Uncharacterized protein n=1 Tax=Paraburkholderia ribeironis TaxID=1247936 RepID=A0A1N7SFL8_9BURK|nr:hypothetical protein BN2475_630042 [Paraburkholderia ribeironis]
MCGRVLINIGTIIGSVWPQLIQAYVAPAPDEFRIRIAPASGITSCRQGVHGTSDVFKLA